MRAGGDDSNFFGNAVLAALALALTFYVGWSVHNAGKSGTISYSYAAAK